MRVEILAAVWQEMHPLVGVVWIERKWIPNAVKVSTDY